MHFSLRTFGRTVVTQPVPKTKGRNQLRKTYVSGFLSEKGRHEARKEEGGGEAAFPEA